MNYVTGSVHGFKFEDINGDGIFNDTRDHDDNNATPEIPAVLSGVAFNIWRFEDSVVNTAVNPNTTVFTWVSDGTTTTDAFGRFWFTDLQPGRYALREILDSPPSLAPVDDTWLLSTAQADTDDFFDNGGVNSDPDDPATGTFVINSREEFVYEVGASGEILPPFVPGQPGSLKTEVLRNSNTGLDPTSLLFGNYEPVTIKGQKFEDLNGDGNFDAGEPFFEDITFELLNADGSPYLISVPTTTGPGTMTMMVPYQVQTDANGEFCFENVDPGTYIVRETLFQDTNPGTNGSNGAPNVAGTTRDGQIYVNEGVLPAPGDLPIDDVAEQGLIRDPMEVTLTVGSQAIVNVSTGQIDPMGVYDITDLNMMVDADGPGPGAPILVTPQNQNQVLSPWFNYVQGSIHGVKFHDLNGNGLMDDTFDHDNDPQTPEVYTGLEGVKMVLWEYVGAQRFNPSTYDGPTTIYNWNMRMTFTDVHGEFWFTDLDPGIYVVREDLTQSAPGFDYSNFMQTSNQGVGSPDGNFGLEIQGENPLNTADAITLISRQEYQWDESVINGGTINADVAANGEAPYQRPMDTSGDGLFSQQEILDALRATALKVSVTPEIGDVTVALPNSLRFGNAIPVDVEGDKFHDLNGNGELDPGEAWIRQRDFRALQPGRHDADHDHGADHQRSRHDADVGSGHGNDRRQWSFHL